MDRAKIALAASDEAKLHGVSVPLVEQEGEVVLEKTPVPYGDDQADGIVDGKKCPKKFNKLGKGVDVWIVDTGCKPTNGGICLGLKEGKRSNNCADEDGHGTHVGGTATGSIYGIATAARRNCIKVITATAVL